MPTDCISYQNSGYFTPLIVDYLNEKSVIKPLYNRFPKLENFASQIEEKSSNFKAENRVALVNALEIQNARFSLSKSTINNIQLLKESNTFTVTTGHQLNLFTGHLYFIYKIVSTINLCEELKIKFPENNFVPIFWMATEDHDFEEINHFLYKGKKISWNRESAGPVGRLSTEGLQEVFDVFSDELGLSENATYLKDVFQKGYLEHQNLSDATRYITNELFKDKGLVILDGDSIELKKQFIPFAKEELLQQTSFKKVNETITILGDYTIQVNPREINLFYIEDNLRERIIFENNSYKVNNTAIEFSETEILAELENHPEKFSPNVILRPIYQEVILPNLCYIGGGGEIAYWLELKTNFEANNVTFPMLLVRNSVVLATKKQVDKADKLHLTWADLFLKQNKLITTKTNELSKLQLDFSQQKEFLKKQFEQLLELSKQTDKSFEGAVLAQQKKQTKGLENLEKRLLKAEKRNFKEKLDRIISLQNELFPKQSLQERKLNFSEFYEEFGTDFLDLVFENLKALEQNFALIELDKH